MGAAMLASPAAYADDVATLPIPPWDPSHGDPIFLPGTGGDWTNVEYVGSEIQYDQTYTLPDGSYEIHAVQDPYNAFPEPWFDYGSEQVISSEGVAPPVGTELTGGDVQIPSWGFEYGLFEYSTLTTSAGMVDIVQSLQAPWANEFYSGPAGIFDYWVNGVGTGQETVTPIIDMPATASAGAAADFSTLWSDLLGTL
jgi:hypothetical protein